MKKIVVMIPTVKESVFFDNPYIELCNCGVGMAECATATAKIIRRSNPDLIILAGIAGSYTDKLAIGDSVAVRSEIVADMGRLCEDKFTGLFQKTYKATLLPEGYKAVNSNTVNCAGAIVKTPHEADIENMEGAAFFSMCEEFSVPAMEIRSISNRVGEEIRSENMILSTGNLALELEKIIASIITR